MAPKDSIALERQGGHNKVGLADDVVHPAITLPVGSPTRPVRLGRFLLSSTGFHLILAWVVISLGLSRAPSVSRPLVVTLIESAGSESSAPSGRLAHGQAAQQAAPRQMASPADVKPMAKPRVLSPSPAPMVEAKKPPAPDEPTGGPKAVGVSAGRSPGAGNGTPDTFVVRGLSPGPILLGSDGDGGAGSGLAGRGGAGRLDAALVAPPASSVIIGSPHGSGGRGSASTAGGAGWTGDGSAGGRSSAPNYAINPLPKYPRMAREKGYEGTVYLRVLVRADGRVEQLAVDRSSGYEILDRAAVDSVKEWAFFPAKKGGKPVGSWVLLPVKFALN